MSPDQFKGARRVIGLTQTGMAQRLGVHPMTVSRWERGLVSIPNPVGKLMRLWAQAGRPQAGRLSGRKR